MYIFFFQNNCKNFYVQNNPWKQVELSYTKYVKKIFLQKNTASTVVLREALEWADVTSIGCDHSSSRLLHTQQFMDLLSSVVDTGYHFMACVKKAVAQALLMIMEAITDQQVRIQPPSYWYVALDFHGIFIYSLSYFENIVF